MHKKCKCRHTASRAAKNICANVGIWHLALPKTTVLLQIFISHFVLNTLYKALRTTCYIFQIEKYTVEQQGSQTTVKFYVLHYMQQEIYTADTADERRIQ